MYIYIYIYTHNMMMNRDRQMRGGGVLQTLNEPESPNEGACLRYMCGKSRRMMGRV